LFLEWDFFMINLNGNIVSHKEAYLEISNRGFTHGDAVFETIRMVNGSLLFYEDHYFRLMAAMRILRMEIPMQFTPEFIESEIIRTVEGHQLGINNGLVTLYVNRKEYQENATTEVEYLIRVSPADLVDYPFYNSPYQIELYKDHYVAPNLLSTVNTNNKALHVLGHIFASENDYDNCLLLNTAKNVVQALDSNLFLVVANKIKTPPLADGCINGIIRKKIIELANVSSEFEIEEASISPFELQRADELFLTNIEIGIRPISQYRKKTYDYEKSRQLLDALNRVINV